jgi:hypothetical protein
VCALKRQFQYGSSEQDDRSREPVNSGSAIPSECIQQQIASVAVSYDMASPLSIMEIVTQSLRSSARSNQSFVPGPQWKYSSGSMPAQQRA